jgi:hypothetical protein
MVYIYTEIYLLMQADDYKETGCLNMQCPGFVAVNQYIAPGTALPSGSSIALAISRVRSPSFITRS